MKSSIKGFILGVIFTAAISVIPAVADSVSKTLDVLVNYVTIAVDGEVHDVPNFIHEGTTYVGLRAMGELIGYDVDWNGETQTALFTSPGSEKIWPEPLAEKTSLVINGKEIAEEDVVSLFDNFKTNYPNASNKEIKQAVINDFSVKAFLDVKAEEFGIEVDMAAIEDSYKEYEETLGSEFEATLAANGVTKEQFYKEYVNLQKYNLLTAEVVMHYVNSDVSEEINAIREEAKAEYDAKADELTKEVVNVKHILIPTTDEDGNKLSDAKVKEAKNLANEILSKLRRGESFENMLIKYNNDPGLTDDGYDVSLGSQFVPEFEAAALALGKNEISNVVETEYGFHIIKAYSKEKTAPDFDEYFEENYLEQCTQEVNNIYAEWLENSDITAEWSF